MKAAIALGILVSFPCIAATPPATDHVIAKVLATGSEKLLFTISRRSADEGGKHRLTDTFRDPEGKEAVKIEAVLDGSDQVDSYTVDEYQTREQGAIRRKDGKLRFEYTKKGGQTETNDEDAVPNFVVGLSIRTYVKAHWKELVAGDSVPIRFGVPERKETVGFKLFKDREAKAQGHDTVVIEMKPSSFVIAALVKPIYFYFDKQSAELVQFVGRTIPKLKDGDSYKDLDALTVYTDIK